MHLAEQELQIKYFNNYVMDPNHLTDLVEQTNMKQQRPPQQSITQTPYPQHNMPPPMGVPIGFGYPMGGQSGFAAPMSYMPGMTPSLAWPSRIGPSSTQAGFSEKRLSDRIGGRLYEEPGAKRQRIMPLTALKIPEGVKEDPRRTRVANYSDLDRAVPASDSLDLDY